MPIIYYDHKCVYCYNYAIWLIRHGLPRNYQFVPLKSDAGRLLAMKHPEVASKNSVILQYGERLMFESTAIVHMLCALRHHRWLGVLLWSVPKPLRDVGYRCFANNRDKLWSTTWAIPTAQEQSFFIE
ncbi:thiol-disulfide oxidoreductase DCC family protein [Staphylococcus americanisciuri]|uniref:DCC1-like thiol-disulfide oxidoreductase family protein n=1 Tax=Staphylococcus americanisciuri TaxID=2973940 RepID=A0ABT2F3G5_9STAP|nr:DCC1-like thiol-disulfide oxidoreductase family protein [Staphylococcus americanisciuri]MCS4486999.1 DCC1-like thiol-disulfide oxidoreductase family protein [Staphylococcus americanisciuri]